MRFAERPWLLGIAFALLVALLLLGGALRQNKALSRFLAPERLATLLTSRPTLRRMIGGILLVSAVVLAFLAAAAPQFGKGTRILPRTNLDVVVVLDYSKSMFARDVSPSRIDRAKIEVTRLIQQLGGARFGAIAFAGEPMAFPLTSDGSAIAQFFQGLTPHDMPVGGTATARALEAGRQLLLRDPLSKNHEKIMVLITDGEDLEGDPKAGAEAAHADGVTVNVVQIGGRSPEPIPDVDEHGQIHGFRKDNKGAPLTTYLTPEGEKQLEEVASVGGGELVRAGQGDTGIDKMADSLRKLMTEELTERVETVYADVFQYPLALSTLFLLAEAWVQLGRRRVRVHDEPLPKTRRRKPRRILNAALLGLLGLGCEPYDRLFERDSPLVEEAKTALQAGDGKKATELLTQYLESGACQEGVIGFGARAKAYPNATFDLALAFGTPDKPQSPAPSAPPAAAAPAPAPAIPGLGLPPSDPGSSGALGGPGGPGAAPASAGPNSNLDCALRLLAPLADNEAEPAALRARALYLMGQVEMKKSEFDAAADAYTRGLRFAPALPEGSGDAIGRDLAFNRLIALLRALEKKKQEEEQKKQDQEKQKQDQDQDSDKKDESKPDEAKPDEKKQDQDSDKKDESKPDEAKPDEKKQDQEEKKQAAGEDKNKPPETPEPSTANQEPPSAPQQAPQVSQDERILDQLEETPTLQEQAAKERARSARGRVLEDK